MTSRIPLRRPRGLRPTLRPALAALATTALLGTLTACGDDDAEPASSQTASTGESSQASSAPADDPSSAAEASEDTGLPSETPTGDAGAEALAFFQSTQADCDAFADSVGNPRIPVPYFASAQVVDDLGGDQWLLLDGAGNRLVVDLGAGVVQSPDGPDATLPTEYSFGCPSELYLGSAAD
ncbi:MAG: hypothetical protein CMH83_03155 [Nocardioides sp.]|nr:hypothetical protein [Nocardioides sp.]